LMNKIRGALTPISRPIWGPIWAEPQPDQPFFAIGDVHGCYDDMRRLLDQTMMIDDSAAVICVGDLIDRGDNSAAVLRFIAEHSSPADTRLHSLMGNHEAMLLGMLDDPEITGPHWLRHGGLQTVASFGLSNLTDNLNAAGLIDLRDHLRDALGPKLEAWLRTRPSSWHSGNVSVVHAGASPWESLEAQEVGHLVWGHPDFATVPRRDGQWIVHGHYIVPSPRKAEGRIAIDTGAYATGRLTGVYVHPERVQFLSA
jgi:serine/threonine protein phosphatase 1